MPGQDRHAVVAEFAGSWGQQENELLLNWVSERGLEEAQVGVQEVIFHLLSSVHAQN